MPRFSVDVTTDPAAWSFGQQLYWHLFIFGTWPDIDPEAAIGRPWLLDQFAAALGVSERAVRNWCQDKFFPNDFGPIAALLFGNNPKHDPQRRRLNALLTKGQAKRARELAAKRGLFNSAADGTPSIVDETIQKFLPVVWRNPKPGPEPDAAGSAQRSPQTSYGPLTHYRPPLEGEIEMSDAAPRASGLSQAFTFDDREPHFRKRRGTMLAAVLGLAAVAVGTVEWRNAPSTSSGDGSATDKVMTRAPPPQEEKAGTTQIARTDPVRTSTTMPSPPISSSPPIIPQPVPEPVKETVPPPPVSSTNNAQSQTSSPAPAAPPAQTAALPKQQTPVAVADKPPPSPKPIQTSIARDEERRAAETARLAALAEEARKHREAMQQAQKQEAQQIADMGFQPLAETRVAGIAMGPVAAENFLECAIACYRDGCDAFAYQTGEPPAGEPVSKACYRYRAPLTRVRSRAYTSGERIALRRDTQQTAPALPVIRLAQSSPPTQTDAGSPKSEACVPGIGTMNIPGFEILCDTFISGGSTLGSNQLAYMLDTAQDCAAKCRPIGRCVAFAYNERPERGKHRCEIFGPTPNAREVKGYISGRR